MSATAATPASHPLGLDIDRVPKHVAIIMDGNGRWAEKRGLPRIWGHREGAVRVREIVERGGDLGITHLTLYAFSSENWKRPADEVSQLMLLCVAYLDGEAKRLAEEGIRLRVIGRRAGLPDEVRQAIDKVEAITAHATRANLTLALNYGGRDEIVDACRTLAAKAASGQIVSSTPASSATLVCFFRVERIAGQRLRSQRSFGGTAACTSPTRRRGSGPSRGGMAAAP